MMELTSAIMKTGIDSAQRSSNARRDERFLLHSLSRNHSTDLINSARLWRFSFAIILEIGMDAVDTGPLKAQEALARARAVSPQKSDS